GREVPVIVGPAGADERRVRGAARVDDIDGVGTAVARPQTDGRTISLDKEGVDRGIAEGVSAERIEAAVVGVRYEEPGALSTEVERVVTLAAAVGLTANRIAVVGGVERVVRGRATTLHLADAGKLHVRQVERVVSGGRTRNIHAREPGS